MSRFIDPLNGYGFRKIFGKKTDKEIIMSFITDVLELKTPLLDLTYVEKKLLPKTEADRGDTYDFYCQDVAGGHFLVEIKKNRIPFVTDRMSYYSTFPIAAPAKESGKRVIGPKPMKIREVSVAGYGNQATPKPLDFDQCEVYCIAVLGYTLNDSSTAINRYRRRRNDQATNEAFSDTLQFVTLELPWFDERQPEYNLDRRLNKWLFFLKYLPALNRIPKFFAGDEVFEKAFQRAEYMRLSPKGRRLYKLSMKRIMDTFAVLSGSYNEGYNQGRIEAGRASLQRLVSQKFGSVPHEIVDSIRAINDLEKIHAIMAQFTAINEWQELQKYLSPLTQGYKVVN